MTSFEDLNLGDGVLKFEKLRMETFKNIERYSKSSIKLIRKLKFKMFLLNFCMCVGIFLLVAFISEIACLINPVDVPLWYRLIPILLISLVIIVFVEIKLHKIMFKTNDKDDSVEISDETAKAKTIIKLHADDFIFGRLLRFIGSTLNTLEKNTKNHDLISKVTSGIYSMFIKTLFDIDKEPSDTKDLESYIESNTPKEFVKLYYESKEEIKTISELIRTNDPNKEYTKEEIQKVDRSCMLLSTDIILLKMLQYFCQQECLSKEELSKIIDLNDEENRDLLKFLYETPIKKDEEIHITI